MSFSTMWYRVILCTAVLVPFGTCFKFIDCGSKFGQFTDIAVTDCDPPNTAYCKLNRGTNATLTVKFTPNEDITEVTAVVHGILGGVPIPFNLPNPNCCKESGLQCPLEKNQQYTYVATLPVLGSYPRVKVTVKWELQTNDKKDIICFELPAKIV
ncbi:NPC intracellular cholesterol transporter 2 homolog a [Halyomorpha halys]|uniref:NPC intracellular cholesterol transporter 2 homolog a n=1 Tax=Halyomorpha halys TaxID=286706 RepID=UPI0006D52877|nr:NPC intracellular cholesterol transporter 2 homolog a [Halyomorpha halys]